MQTYTRLLNDVSDEEIEQQFELLFQQGLSALKEEGVAEEEISAEYSLDCRYLGQSYFLNVKWHNCESAAAQFQKHHAQRYGHALELDVELVNVRVALKSQAEKITLPQLEKSNIPKQETGSAALYGIETEVPIFDRESLSFGEIISGPALITETVSTTYLAPGWQCEVDKSACLLLSKE